MDTVETTDALKKDLGEKDVSILAIGPAGENLVRYAIILADKHGAFGRTGMGAVMGSKNLKAIAIKGTMTPPIADPDKLRSVYAEIIKKAKEKASQYDQDKVVFEGYNGWGLFEKSMASSRRHTKVYHLDL